MKRSLTEILKIPAIVVGCIGAVIGAYKYFESIPKRTEVSNKEIIETVKNYSDSTNIHFQSIESILKDHSLKLDNVVASQKTMKNLVTREFAKTMTPQQVLEMMQQFDESKKNNSEYLDNMIMTSDSIWTLYNSTSK